MRFEVLVESAHSKTGFLHQVCDSDPGKPLFAELLRGDTLMSLRLFRLGRRIGPPKKLQPKRGYRNRI